MGFVANLVAVVLAGLLLYSGLAKLVAPGDLSTAIAELLNSAGSYRWAVRAIAIVEIATSVLLALRRELPVTRIAVGGLGLSFAAVGVAGWLRRTQRPCGCFGSSTAGSFGSWNATIGLAFVLWAGSPWQHTYDRALTVVAALVVATAIPSWGNRRYLLMVLNRRAARERTR